MEFFYTINYSKSLKSHVISIFKTPKLAVASVGTKEPEHTLATKIPPSAARLADANFVSSQSVVNAGYPVVVTTVEVGILKVAH